MLARAGSYELWQQLPLLRAICGPRRWGCQVVEMSCVLAVLPLVPSCWNDPPEILAFHRMVANQPLRVPV